MEEILGTSNLKKFIVFIDGMNFLKAWRGICKLKHISSSTRWDAIKLREVMKGLLPKQRLADVRYYSSSIRPKDARLMQSTMKGLTGLHNALNKIGFTCIIRKNRVRQEECPLCHGTFPKLKEKGVDVSIAIDMVTFGIENKFDSAILVSGDADFIPAVEYLKKLHKFVIVVQFRDVISEHLKHNANQTIFLDKYFEQLILKK
ncbi:MAG: NYN domain-containing protein [Candidatus Thorarchaeota archaeon]